MKKLWQSISISEWKMVVALTVILIVVTTLPFVIGFLHTPADTSFNGLHALSYGDGPVYYSYIRQISSGENVIKDNFTSEPQYIGTFNAWWWMVGVFNRAIGDHVIIVFQLARILMIPIFAASMYLFVSYCMPLPRQRLYALVFIFFSAGVGLYAAPIVDQWHIADIIPYHWPIDLWIAEAITFNAVFHSSHFIASITCMILIFLLFLISNETKKIAPVLIAGAIALFFFNFHPYYAPVVALVIGGYTATISLIERRIAWRSLWSGALIGGIGLPSILYHVWLIMHEPVIGIRAAQNITLNSPWPYVIIGFGFLLPGAILGIWMIARRKIWNPGLILITIWGAVNGILMFAPTPFQSRYTQGTHIVLSILSVYGLYWLYEMAMQKLPRRVAIFWVQNPILWGVMFVILYMPSTLYSLTRDVYYFWAVPRSIQGFFYVPHDLTDAGVWLNKNSDTATPVVLGSELGSRFLSLNTGAKFYLAHGHETIEYKQKLSRVQNIFRGEVDKKDLLQWLQKNNITYILLSENEKKWGASPEYFDRVLLVAYRNDTVTLYRVPIE